MANFDLVAGIIRSNLANWKPEGVDWHNDLSEPISHLFGDWDNTRDEEKAMKAFIERRKRYDETA